MAEIIFFEKPGCINNEKQKKILRQAGNSLQCEDILAYEWTMVKLLPFLEGKEPYSIINAAAPAVKRGELIPAQLSFSQAIGLMLKDPLLIKRPLIKVDDLYIQGFEDVLLKPYLGNWDGQEDVITCPNLKTISCDEKRSRSS